MRVTGTRMRIRPVQQRREVKYDGRLSKQPRQPCYQDASLSVHALHHLQNASPQQQQEGPRIRANSMGHPCANFATPPIVFPPSPPAAAPPKPTRCGMA